MNQKRAEFYLILLLSALFTLTFTYLRSESQQTTQSPNESISISQREERGKVLMGTPSPCYMVELKDAESNANITGATVVFVNPRAALAGTSPTTGWNFTTSYLYSDGKQYKVYSFYCSLKSGYTRNISCRIISLNIVSISCFW